MSVNWKKVLLFLGLTFLVNWTMVISYLRMGGSTRSIWWGVLLLTYMLIPLLVAVFVQKVIARNGVFRPLGIVLPRRWGWFFAGWILIPLIGLATFGVALLLPGIRYSPGMEGFLGILARVLSPEQIAVAARQAQRIPPPVLLLLSVAQGLIYGATVNAIAAMGEEAGWRGFLQRELAPLGFWASSLLIGAIWGIWHAPVILTGYNYPQHPVAGVFMMTAFTILIGIIISYVRLQSRSTITAAVMHGTLNGSWAIPLLFIAGGSDLTNGFMGLTGIIVMTIVVIALTIYDTKFARIPIMFNRDNVLKAVGLTE